MMLETMLACRARPGKALVHVTMLTLEEEADARFAHEVRAVHVGGDALVKL